MAFGGAVAAYGTGTDLLVASFYDNEAIGERGGAAPRPRRRRRQRRGRCPRQSSLLSVSNSFFGATRPTAAQGAGPKGIPIPGGGGAGGAATGGAVENEGFMQLTFTTFSNNEVSGGGGGQAYTAAGVGGAGGNVQGGGGLQ